MDACAGNVTDVCKLGQELLMSVRNAVRGVCWNELVRFVTISYIAIVNTQQQPSPNSETRFVF